MASGRELEIVDIQALRLRGHVLLRLGTRSGLRGHGECAALGPEELALARERIVGRPATAYEVIGQLLAERPAVRAAADMALLDIVGQAARAPVYQVLGGPTRFKVRALGRLTGETDEALAASLGRAEAAGFRCHAVPLPAARARSQAFVDAVRHRLESLRKAASAEANFVLDGAGRLAPGVAAALCAALERFHLLWFDEPCPVSSGRGVARLAAEHVTPVGFGRTIDDPGLFQDLLRESAADVLRPDIRRHGISGIRRLAAIAETYYVAVAPYQAGGPVGAAACLHAAASLPNSFAVDLDPASAAVKGGYAELPRGPGLGVAVDQEFLEKYKERPA
jgi:galactonate dehydratase